MLCNLYSFVKMSISYQIIIITLIIMSGTSMLFFTLYLLILAVLDLHWCPRAFFSCGEQGPLSSCSVQLLNMMASLLWSPGSRARWFSSCDSWTLDCGLSSYDPWACSMVCEIFLDLGLNSHPPHWQADS